VTLRRLEATGPALGAAAEHCPLRELALATDHPADAGELLLERLVGDDDLVEVVGHLACDARPLQGHARGEVAALDHREDLQQDLAVNAVPGVHR
jgi:hypothetical protein